MTAVHTAVARALAEHGVEAMFGVMGQSNMTYIAEFVDLNGGHYYAAKHEAGAASMADGYARITGGIGVATVTHGPGLTNAVTALIEAVRARTPMLLLTAESPTVVGGHRQRLDIPATVAPTGAGYHRINRPQDVVDDIGRTLRRLSLERRPYVLDIPADIAGQQTEYRTSAYGVVSPTPVEPDADALDVALGRLLTADRPLVLAGRGAVVSGARDALIALADRIGAPLATTVLARGMFAGHPLNLGICGSIATSVGITAIQRADCIIAFGAGLNAHTTERGAITRDKAVIQIDVDEAAIGRYGVPDCAVVADARKVAEAMLARLEAAGESRTRNNSDLVRALAELDPAAEFHDTSRPGTVNTRAAMLELNRILPSKRTVVTDAGRYMLGVWRSLEATEPKDCLCVNNFGAIGFALGTAVGAAAGRPDQLCLAIIGDGAAMASLLELDTAVLYGLPLAIVVINDESYGTEHQKLAEAGFEPTHADFRRPDLAALARSLGADGMVIDSLEALAELKPEVFAPENLPVLIDIKADVEAEAT